MALPVEGDTNDGASDDRFFAELQLPTKMRIVELLSTGNRISLSVSVRVLYCEAHRPCAKVECMIILPNAFSRLWYFGPFAASNMQLQTGLSG